MKTILFDKYEWNHVAEIIGQEGLLEVMFDYENNIYRYPWKIVREMIVYDCDELGIFDDDALDFYSLVRDMWRQLCPEEFEAEEYECFEDDDEFDRDYCLDMADKIWISLGD